MSWAEVYGHDTQRQRLENAATRGRLAHAYLFVGPAGIGKHRFALELAKLLLCERRGSAWEACDRCAACVQVQANTHPDFLTACKTEDKLEFTIDVVRGMTAQLALRPIRGGRKVAIIEDADDFNEEAANCFLKTLEEPPDGAMLILLATSIERQLPTILSRCQVLRFQRLDDVAMENLLARTDAVAAELIPQLIRLSQGSVGRAVALADETVRECRTRTIQQLGAARPNAVELARNWIECLEEAGKESASQRERATRLMALVGSILGDALRIQQGLPATEPSENDRIQLIADRCTEDHLLQHLEATVEAERLIDRRVPLPLIMEQLAQKLCTA